MRFSSSRRARQNDESILPLTNVVFLLLIFFMLAGRLTSPQPFDVDPPRSQSQTPAATAGLQVDIAADGLIAFDGDPIQLPDLKTAVQKRLHNDPDTLLRLKADGGVDATRVVAVMGVLHDAGAEKLRLITVIPEQ